MNTNTITCNICYSNEIHHKIKCNTCKHNVCSDCFGNIIFNNDKFHDNYIDDTACYRCPYCTNNTTFTSKKLNHLNINDKLVKLVIKETKQYVSYAINIIEDYNILVDENIKMKNEINVLKRELEDEKEKKIRYRDRLKESKLQIQLFDGFPAAKYEKINELLKITNKRTILYNQIKYIINS